MNAEKLAKMAAQVRTGGKGSVRRKKKAIHKTTTTDDKRLQNTLKRLGVNNIPAIEEVNLFKDNGTVVHFNNPKGARCRGAVCTGATVVLRCARPLPTRSHRPTVRSPLPSIVQCKHPSLPTHTS